MTSQDPQALATIDLIDADGLVRMLQDQDLADGFAYWRSRVRDGRLPGRADIDPVDIPRLLRYVLLVDELTGPGRRCRLRVQGTALTERANRNSTGLYLTDMMTDRHYSAYILGLYDRMLDRREVLYTHGLHRRGDGLTQGVKRLMMPLAGADGHIEMCFCLMKFQTSRPDVSWEYPPPSFHETGAAVPFDSL